MTYRKAKKWFEQKLKESGIDMEDSENMLKLMNQLQEENPEAMNKIHASTWRMNLAYKISTSWFFLKLIIRIPAFILIAFVLIAILLPFNLLNSRSFIANLALKRLPIEEERKIYERVIEYANHFTGIFYILVVLWLILNK